MRRVIIESPYAGDVEEDQAYARWCMLDCLRRGEAPMASHLLYTQVLDDTVPNERKLGMEAGFAWTAVAEAVVVYVDRGLSRSMKDGIAMAKAYGIPVEMRRQQHHPDAF